MPRRNRKVRDANRDRARKHSHRHDTQVTPDESRDDRPSTWHARPTYEKHEGKLRPA